MPSVPLPTDLKRVSTTRCYRSLVFAGDHPGYPPSAGAFSTFPSPDNCRLPGRWGARTRSPTRTLVGEPDSARPRPCCSTYLERCRWHFGGSRCPGIGVPDIAGAYPRGLSCRASDRNSRQLAGVRVSGIAWTLPTYVGGMFVVIVLGVWKTVQSGGNPTPMEPRPLLPDVLAPVSIWLIIRALASGCTAMTGIEAVSNGVSIFAEPAVKNACRTLALICGILALLLAGIGFLAHTYGIGARNQAEAGYQSVVSQICAAVTGRIRVEAAYRP
jgi:hypothetical protein